MSKILGVVALSLAFLALSQGPASAQVTAPVDSMSPDEPPAGQRATITTDPYNGSFTFKGTVTSWPFGKKPAYVQIYIKYTDGTQDQVPNASLDQNMKYSQMGYLYGQGKDGTIYLQPKRSDGSNVGDPSTFPVTVK
jgi:hypothetical protein